MGQGISARVRPYLSWPWVSRMTFSPEDQRGRRLLRSGPNGLAFLRAVDSAEADTLYRSEQGLRRRFQRPSPFAHVIL